MIQIMYTKDYCVKIWYFKVMFHEINESVHDFSKVTESGYDKHVLYTNGAKYV